LSSDLSAPSWRRLDFIEKAGRVKEATAIRKECATVLAERQR
jgi:hypothetical protein